MSFRRLWLTYLPPALVLGFGALALVLASDHERHRTSAIVELVAGWSFVGAGLIAWARRPENHTGLLMTLVGFAFFFTSLREANASLPYTLGYVLGSVFLAVFTHLLVAYPRGYLAIIRERLIVGGSYLLAIVGPLTLSFVRSPLDSGCHGCPRNAFVLVDSSPIATALGVLFDGLGIALLLAVFVLLVDRWRSAASPGRHVLGPVYVSGGAALALLAISFVVDAVTGSRHHAVGWAPLIAFASVPFFFLFGLLRTRLAHADVNRTLLEEVPAAPTPAQAQDGLRRAVRDPTLELLYWRIDTQTYIDIHGKPVRLPPDTSNRISTVIEYDARPVAALVHDSSVLDEPEILRAVVNTARVALERDRLAIELQSRLDELRTERDFISAVLETAPSLVCVFDRQGRLTHFNRECQVVTGYSLEELRERPFWDVLVPEEQREGVRQALEDVFERGVANEHENEWVTREGERRLIAWGNTVLTDERGRPAFGVGTGVDITERRLAVRELQASERRTRAILDAIPDLMFRIARDGTYLAYKTTAADDLYEPEVVGRTVRERLPARVAERLMAAGARALADRTSVQTIEYQLEFDSELREYEGRVVASAEDEFLLIVRNITERKRSEQALRESRARIVEAGDVERRRLERNLHDGAQQHLVALSLSLRLAQAKLGKDPEGATQIIASATEQLSRALEELRELARGIHPAILSDRGLPAALEALAARFPLPVELETPPGRLPESVEAAAYYVVSESLTNVAKYAQATAVKVSVGQRNGLAIVQVRDDGVGGADPTGGSGLRGLADRVEALDGRIVVASPPGEGTTVTAEIPCE